MSTIFPRLDPNLVITTGVERPTALKSIEAIKQDVVQKLNQVGIGKHIQGEVLAKLTDGSFVAKVDGTPMRLSLPAGTQIGEKLSLTLLHLTPRPVFLLNGLSQVTLLDSTKKGKLGDILLQNYNSASGASADSLYESDDLPAGHNPAATRTTSQEHASLNQLAAAAKSSASVAVLGQETTTLANQALASPAIAASTQTALSTAGQLINLVLQETKDGPEKLSIIEKSPLLTEEMSKLPTPQLARHLESSLLKNISQSGIFYESHVAEWSIGKRSMTELQAEPQAKIAVNLDASILINKDDHNHAGLAQLVHQQLDVLEQHKLQWSGMLAPQMPLQWMIEESTDKHASSTQENAAENQHWHSYLSVELPNLGLVIIDVNLHSDQLQVSVKSDASATTTLLQSNYPELQKAIEETGTHIQSFTVQHNE